MLQPFISQKQRRLDKKPLGQLPQVVDGLDEIVWWVLSMGPHAVVREPAELRERVAAQAKATAALYAEKKE